MSQLLRRDDGPDVGPGDRNDVAVRVEIACLERSIGGQK